MTDITTPQQHPVPYVQRVAQIICTGLYPEADAAGKLLADFPKATRENLLTIAEAILLDTTTEAQSAHRYAWWVTARDELDGLAPAQLIIGGPLDTADGTPLQVDAHQRRHFLKPWRERLAMLLQLLALPAYEVGGSAGFAGAKGVLPSATPADQAEDACAVPEGYALVPLEPTPEMQEAAARAIRFDTTALDKIWTANAVYRAAIGAAMNTTTQSDNEE